MIFCWWRGVVPGIFFSSRARGENKKAIVDDEYRRGAFLMLDAGYRILVTASAEREAGCWVLDGGYSY